MAGWPTRYASCSVVVVKLIVSNVTNECSVDAPCMSEYMSEEVLARLSRPWCLFFCTTWGSIRGRNFPIRTCTTMAMLMALRSTDTLTLITDFVAFLTFAIFTCCRFDLAFLLPFWPVAVWPCTVSPNSSLSPSITPSALNLITYVSQILSTNSVLHSLSGSIWNAIRDLGPGHD